MFPRPLQTPCFGSKPPLASLQAWSHNTCTLGDCVARIKFIIPPDETCTCSFWNACPIQADHTDVCSVYGSGVEFSTLHAKNSKVHCMVENPHRILQVLYRNSRHGTVNTLSFERNFFGPHTLFRWDQPRGYAVQNSFRTPVQTLGPKASLETRHSRSKQVDKHIIVCCIVFPRAPGIGLAAILLNFWLGFP